MKRVEEINKGDLVKLNDGKVVVVINLPSSFMANGSYQVSLGDGAPKFWVKPEQILYKINKKWDANINDYFEIVMDENGINMIPKDIVSIDIETQEGFNYIKLSLGEGRKHTKVNLYLGDLNVIDEPEKEEEKKSFIEKIFDITKKDEQ